MITVAPDVGAIPRVSVGRARGAAGVPDSPDWGAMTGFAFLLASAVLLTVGAELFAEHASAAGRRLGVTALAVGLVLAGAEPEELVTAIFATLRHHPGIAVGDAIGANLTMLTLVLGLAAVLRPLPFGPTIRVYALAAGAAGVAAAAILVGGRVGRIEGAVLVVLYAALLGLVWWRERRPPAFGEAAELGESDRAGERPSLALVLVLAGVAAMVVGGRLAVAGAERIVSTLGLADSAVGLTFVALATTAELLALVWAAARRSVPELAVAAVLGSAAYNATATLGVAALVEPLSASGVSGAAWAAAVLPLALLALTARQGRIARGLGVALLGGYAVFLVLTLT